MEGGVKCVCVSGGGGGGEAISCSPEKMYHRNSRNSGNFAEVHSLSVLELVRASSVQEEDIGWRDHRNWVKEKETKDEKGERRVKDPSCGWRWWAGKTIFHFFPRGLGARAASLRGFLQISSLVSSASLMWPAEARWQLQLIAQPRLVREEWEREG